MKRILGLAMAVMMLFGATAFAANTTTKSPAGKAEAKATVKKKVSSRKDITDITDITGIIIK